MPVHDDRRIEVQFDRIVSRLAVDID